MFKSASLNLIALRSGIQAVKLERPNSATCPFSHTSLDLGDIPPIQKYSRRVGHPRRKLSGKRLRGRPASHIRRGRQKRGRAELWRTSEVQTIRVPHPQFGAVGRKLEDCANGMVEKQILSPSTKIALVTGVTGQDGAYLSQLLLSKGYVVHGIKRRSSSFNTSRIEDLYEDPHVEHPRFILHYGDMIDSTNLIRVVQECQPDEIYNLAAQSHVMVSFETPEYTANADALGTLRLLEAMRILGLERKTKFYQASTSEMYGLVQETPQTERTPFYPRSPYAAAKLYAYWITVNYREAYGLHASNGILFNHESALRGETFVTRKITRAAAAIKLKRQKKLYLGNLDAKRDWGHAREYVRGMWLMLQQEVPDDYVLSTGVTTLVRTFVEWAFQDVGIPIQWKGRGLSEKGLDRLSGEVVVEIDPRYFRPTEVDVLVGDSSKAHTKLGWRHEMSVRDLAREMVQEDLKLMQTATIAKEG